MPNGELTREDIEAEKQKLNDITDVDFVLLGCPHCSLDEIKRISELLKGKRAVKEFWIATASYEYILSFLIHIESQFVQKYFIFPLS